MDRKQDPILGPGADRLLGGVRPETIISFGLACAGASGTAGLPWDVLRTALRPRWLALLAVVLVVASGMAALGNWQLSRARERSADAVHERQQAPPRPLESLLTARRTFTADLVDAPVVANGRWDGARQLLVTREQDGAEGFWLLTPLVLGDGSAVAVVRGWTDDAGAADAVRSTAPSGQVQVRGVLRPAEPPAPRHPGDPDPAAEGRLASVDVTTLIKVWPYPLLTGYLIATDPVAAAAAGDAVLRPVDTVDDEAAGLALQNLSYALQWWVFAGLGLLFWWRLVRDDARGQLRPGGPAGGPVGDDVAEPEPEPESGDQQPEKVEQS